MLSDIFAGLFDKATTTVIGPGNFILCIGASLVLGVILACSYSFRARCSGSYFHTLVILPCTVCAVIMMVNGNVGAGVAVAGAFSLVRFRSAQGNGKEIGMVFTAMGTGLMTGMGYIAYAFLFTLIVAAVFILSNISGRNEDSWKYRSLRITVPEDLDYEGAFDDILSIYCTRVEESSVKTTDMGSLFRITFDIEMKDKGKEKEMIDRLRTRNGNLEISISRQGAGNSAL